MTRLSDASRRDVPPNQTVLVITSSSTHTMPGALTMLPVSGNCPARARAATVSRRPVAAKVASRHISQHRHARGCEASTSGLDTPCGLEPLHSIHTASLVAALWAVECLPSLAAEADMVAYNSTGQSESITNIVGFFYIGLVCYFFYKVFTRRAKKFTSEVRSSHKQRPRPLAGHAPPRTTVYAHQNQN